MLRIFLFGATGDLSLKKLYPALFELYHQKKLPEDVEIVCIGRRPYTDSDFQQFIAEHVGGVRDVKLWFQFIRHLKYHPLAFENLEDYLALASAYPVSATTTQLLYLATAPEYFQQVVAFAHDAKIIETGNLNHRIVIEKPFGKNLETARQINRHMALYLTEDQIYRMDHYLGKEMIQNILMLRFNNTLFEASWNNVFIDHVQITVAESYGVFERAGYYDSSGAIRDMIQSHLLQMLALVAMTPESTGDYKSICDAKVEVLEHLSIGDVNQDVVLGQYTSDKGLLGYREEKGVRLDSTTETYTAMKLQVDLPRWQGVDFYLRTGKRLSSKVSEIIIVYKQPQSVIGKNSPANTLTIQIHPEEGMKLKFNMKKPGTVKELVTRDMTFCQSCIVDYTSVEAYETLINEVVLGKHDLYTRWDEVKFEWTFVEQLLASCRDLKSMLQFYPAGSRGPESADALLEKDGRQWLSL